MRELLEIAGIIILIAIVAAVVGETEMLENIWSGVLKAVEELGKAWRGQ
jgi:hypothetical protein